MNVDSSTPLFRATVTKGCPEIGVRKGQAILATIDRTVVGTDACLCLGTSASVANGRILWLSGNRTRLPTVSVGGLFNLNDGNPKRRVQICITEVTPASSR